ncbi:TrbC/VirB2 family protein [Paenibacillus aestuarii]|uniref:TrbC/VirB2 family protein n=1 Tax=Paenibacillus aestuarii TaxID=516965 RepID=A0ABW0KBA4_9BACL
MKTMKRIIPLILLAAVLCFSFGNLAFADDVTTLNKDIYKDSTDNILATKVTKIVKIVAGVGAVAFVLAILIIALFIIFGSISAKDVGTWWKALFSCIAGAFVFFSAYAFAPAIASLAFNN